MGVVSKYADEVALCCFSFVVVAEVVLCQLVKAL